MLLVTVLLKHVMQCGETTRQVIYPFLQRVCGELLFKQQPVVDIDRDKENAIENC